MTRIVQISDLHLFADPAGRLFGIPTADTLREVAAHIAAHAGEVDHLVVTGDHTHDELAETCRAVRSILEPWLDRLWQVPGNHDDRAVLRAVFADRISGEGADPVRFAFTAGDRLCLGLDTQRPGHVPGLVDEAQLAWVRERIAEHDPVGVILFMHHPPVLLGSAWLDPIGLAGREALQELVLADRRIELVCCGHVHHDSMRAIGGTPVVTTPSTGLQFDPRGETTTFAFDPPGYRIVEIEDGTVTTRVARLPEARFTPAAA